MGRERLKAERRSLGYTQEKMSEELGLQLRQYKNIESGASLGKIAMWDRLEDLTGVNQRVLREISPDKEGSQ